MRDYIKELIDNHYNNQPLKGTRPNEFDYLVDKDVKKMKCFYCNNDVRWNNDFDTEDTHPDSDHEIVSMYECDKCNAWYEVFNQLKEKING